MGWFRKEDWWIVIISVLILGFSGCTLLLKNSVDDSRKTCYKEGGELIYLDKSGYYCIQKGVIIK